MPVVTTVRWDSGVADTTKIMRSLAETITDAGADEYWELAYPNNAAEIDSLQEFVIKKIAGDEFSISSGVQGYIHFRKPETIVADQRGLTPDPLSPGDPYIIGSRDNHYCIECRLLKTLELEGEAMEENSLVGTEKEDEDSEWARFSWFMADTNAVVKAWLPIRYWVSITPTSFQIILSGDPNASAYDRIIGWGYFGQVQPFRKPCINDHSNSLASELNMPGMGIEDQNNFGMCVSSDVEPNYSKRYSDKTGTGVTDFVMLGTATGFPFQAHYVAQTTPYEFVDKALEGPSAYTDKYHMSPLYVFHGFDGYRGELEGVISCDRSSIVHLDDLIVNKAFMEDPNAPELVYKAFLINAPYSLMSNGPNVMYAIAVLRRIVNPGDEELDLPPTP